MLIGALKKVGTAKNYYVQYKTVFKKLSATTATQKIKNHIVKLPLFKIEIFNFFGKKISRKIS